MGAPLWLTGAMIVFCIAFPWFAFRGRGNWGDCLVIAPGMLSASAAGKERQRVDAAAVSHVLVKPDCIAVQWPQNGKRVSLMIGAECFTEPTWAALNVAFKAFAADIPADKFTAIKAA